LDCGRQTAGTGELSSGAEETRELNGSAGEPGMSWGDFFIIFITCGLLILICRVVPLFFLKGKELPNHVAKALSFIPPAAFAALVANDIFSAQTFALNDFSALIPILAAIPVFIVAWLSKSLVWSAVVGVASFALLAFLTSGLAL
jgi:branched-subunit amino acid transport protein